jgi:hypothetical protein
MPDLTDDEIIQRLADVSHATWLLQSVRDSAKRFDDPGRPGPAHYKGTEAWKVDCKRAGDLLRDVIAGKRLVDLADDPDHHATPHDRERAENSLDALKKLNFY